MYRIRISPDDVGERVSVRSRIPAAEGQPTLTDAVGILVAWSDGRLTVERRDGSHAQIDEADLVAGRRLPPPPARHRAG